MSSELSAQYRLELAQKMKIENDCRAALKACQDRRAAEKARWAQADADWKRKSEEAAGQAASGQEAAEDQVREKLWELRRRLAVLQERSRVLQGAEEFRAQVQLAESMLTDRSSFDFVEARLNWLEQEELPRCEAETVAAQQQNTVPGAQAPSRSARAAGATAQRAFVAMNFAAKETEQQETAPWTQFCSRVQQMLEQAGENALPEMTALAERVYSTGADRQNERMLQERELLARLERQAARMAQMRQNTAEQQGQRQQYQFLCKKLGITEKTLSGEMLREENARLFRLWCAQEEEKYIQKSLKEVFEQEGISFVSPDDRLAVTAKLSDALRIDMERDTMGMFSMEVYGVADSAQKAAEQKEQMVAQCRHFCKKFPRIVDALREKGILLEDIGQIEPEKATLHVRAGSTRGRTVTAAREQEARIY